MLNAISSVARYRGSLVCLLLGLALSCACDSRPKSVPKPEAVAQNAEPPSISTIELSFVYGSEKKSWLSAAIDAFNGSTAARLGAAKIKVTGLAAGSGTSLDDIVNHTQQPDVWSPASDLYRPMLNRAWIKKHGATGGSAGVAPEGKSLVLSPVVIAMWKPMAEALGWPDKALGWSDVLRLSLDPKGWESVGHPEWGLFKLGHTHPAFSNSGLFSVLAETYAALGVTRGLTVESFRDAKANAFVRDIEQSIVHYGTSTGFFAEKMLTRGPPFLSAAVLYENLVVDSYTQERFRERALDVVSIYPKEGTFWIDNPFIVLDAPWVTDEKRQASKQLLEFLLGPEQQTRAMQKFGFRPSDPTIPMQAPMDAAHGVDPRQPKTLLELPSADVIDAALEFWKANKKPVDIMFVFDRSGSMKGPPLAGAKAGALEFLNQLDARDGVSLVLFNQAVPEQIRAPVEIASHRAELAAQISSVFADGGTALYDAVSRAYAKAQSLAAAAPKRIYAVVVLTDGRDAHSKSTLLELERAIRVPAESVATPVRLFTIAYGNEADPEVLKQIAEVAGGASFVGDTASIGQIYRELAAFF